MTRNRSGTTVSLTQGYGVGHDDSRRNNLFDALERHTKRVLRTWAPSADWGLLAAGRLGAVIAYRNEPWDLVGGALIAEEAGAVTHTDPTGDLVIVGHPQTVRELRHLLSAWDPSRPRHTPSHIRPGLWPSPFHQG